MADYKRTMAFANTKLNTQDERNQGDKDRLVIAKNVSYKKNGSLTKREGFGKYKLNQIDLLEIKKSYDIATIGLFNYYTSNYLNLSNKSFGIYSPFPSVNNTTQVSTPRDLSDVKATKLDPTPIVLFNLTEAKKLEFINGGSYDANGLKALHNNFMLYDNFLSNGDMFANIIYSALVEELLKILPKNDVVKVDVIDSYIIGMLVGRSNLVKYVSSLIKDYNIRVGFEEFLNTNSGLFDQSSAVIKNAINSIKKFYTPIFDFVKANIKDVNKFSNTFASGYVVDYNRNPLSVFNKLTNKQRTDLIKDLSETNDKLFNSTNDIYDYFKFNITWEGKYGSYFKTLKDDLLSNDSQTLHDLVLLTIKNTIALDIYKLEWSQNIDINFFDVDELDYYMNNQVIKQSVNTRLLLDEQELKQAANEFYGLVGENDDHISSLNSFIASIIYYADYDTYKGGESNYLNKIARLNPIAKYQIDNNIDLIESHTVASLRTQALLSDINIDSFLQDSGFTYREDFAKGVDVIFGAKAQSTLFQSNTFDSIIFKVDKSLNYFSGYDALKKLLFIPNNKMQTNNVIGLASTFSKSINDKNVPYGIIKDTLRVRQGRLKSSYSKISDEVLSKNINPYEVGDVVKSVTVESTTRYTRVHYPIDDMQTSVDNDRDLPIPHAWVMNATQSGKGYVRILRHSHIEEFEIDGMFEDVVLDKDGNWYATGFSKTGAVLYKEKQLIWEQAGEKAFNVVLDKDNNWYVTTFSGKIYKNSNLIFTEPDNAALMPRAICVDKNNNWYAGFNNNKIYKNGQLLFTAPNVTNITSGIKTIAVDLYGNWYAGCPGKIVRNGEDWLLTPNTRAIDICVDGDNNVYSSVSGVGIYKNKSLLSFEGPAPASIYGKALNIAIDKDGRLVIQSGQTLWYKGSTFIFTTTENLPSFAINSWGSRTGMWDNERPDNVYNLGQEPHYLISGIKDENITQILAHGNVSSPQFVYAKDEDIYEINISNDDPKNGLPSIIKNQLNLSLTTKVEDGLPIWLYPSQSIDWKTQAQNVADSTTEVSQIVNNKMFYGSLALEAKIGPATYIASDTLKPNTPVYVYVNTPYMYQSFPLYGYIDDKGVITISLDEGRNNELNSASILTQLMLLNLSLKTKLDTVFKTVGYRNAIVFNSINTFNAYKERILTQQLASPQPIMDVYTANAKSILNWDNKWDKPYDQSKFINFNSQFDEQANKFKLAETINTLTDNKFEVSIAFKEPYLFKGTDVDLSSAISEAWGINEAGQRIDILFDGSTPNDEVLFKEIHFITDPTKEIDGWQINVSQTVTQAKSTIFDFDNRYVVNDYVDFTITAWDGKLYLDETNKQLSNFQDGKSVIKDLGIKNIIDWTKYDDKIFITTGDKVYVLSFIKNNIFDFKKSNGTVVAKGDNGTYLVLEALDTLTYLPNAQEFTVLGPNLMSDNVYEDVKPITPNLPFAQDFIRINPFTGVVGQEVKLSSIISATSIVEGEKATYKWEYMVGNVKEEDKGKFLSIPLETDANITNNAIVALAKVKDSGGLLQPQSLTGRELMVRFAQDGMYTIKCTATLNGESSVVLTSYTVNSSSVVANVPETQKDNINKCRRVLLYKDTLLFYGDGSTNVYGTAPHNPYYFPFGNTISIDTNKSEPVTTLVNLKDLVLAFTKSTISAITGGGNPVTVDKLFDPLLVVQIESRVGSVGLWAANNIENTAMFMSENGCYIIEQVYLSEKRADLKRLDTGIQNIVPKLSTISVNSVDKRLHISDGVTSTMLVYDYEYDKWTTWESKDLMIRWQRLIGDTLYVGNQTIIMSKQPVFFKLGFNEFSTYPDHYFQDNLDDYTFEIQTLKDNGTISSADFFWDGTFNFKRIKEFRLRWIMNQKLLTEPILQIIGGNTLVNNQTNELNNLQYGNNSIVSEKNAFVLTKSLLSRDAITDINGRNSYFNYIVDKSPWYMWFSYNIKHTGDAPFELTGVDITFDAGPNSRNRHGSIS